ncbi:hypothetical protein ACSZM9_22465, partial [Aeromonas hydrophila]|uniref:hypothetical protein n=1 Tax=Aeromonas hydrophila TaxID=644 RepID=UPI003EC627C6
SGRHLTPLPPPCPPQIRAGRPMLSLCQSLAPANRIEATLQRPPEDMAIVQQRAPDQIPHRPAY